MKKKILFITQNLGRTGAEMLLWYVINSLDPSEFDISVICNKKGELYDLLPKHIEKNVMYKGSRNWGVKFFRKLLKIFGVDPVGYQLQRIQNSFRADIWYINTIVIHDVYDIAQKMNIKVVTHVHELPMAYSLVSYQGMQKIIKYSDIFIGCSKIVCRKLEDMGKKNVHLLNSFIDKSKIKITRDRAQVRQAVGLTNNEYVWAISGKTTITKGIDLLIPLLENLTNDVRIIWIGGEDDNGAYFYAKQTIDKRFNGRVLFVGEQADEYYNYLDSADGFLLLSREDSFPLVMIEAAALGKPIVGFNSGGIKEFVDEGMGIVVDSWDFKDLAKALYDVQCKADHFDSNNLIKRAGDYDLESQLVNLKIILGKIG